MRPAPWEDAAGRSASAGGALERALVLSAAAGVLAGLAPPPLAALAAVALAIAGALWRRRLRETSALLLGAAAMTAGGLVPAIAHLAPAPIVLGLAVAALAWGGRPPWLRLGARGPAALGWAAAVAALSAAALLAWWHLARPDVSDLSLTAELHRRVPSPALLAAALLAWSVVNAAAEEGFFRGALQDGLARALGVNPAVLLQALVFGLLHLHGFPRGASGVALATIYGGMLGTLRVRTRGLLAPWAAHVAADAVIGSILIVAG